MPTLQDFRNYIQYIRSKASDQSLDVFELSAEAVHESVAGKSKGYVDIEACREAMRAEMKPGDKVLRARNGKKTNLTIAYKS